MILGLIPALTTNIVPAQAAPPPFLWPNTDQYCHLRSTTPFTLPSGYVLTGDISAPFCIFLHPGIADGYNLGWSHTLGTLSGVEGGITQRRQVFDKYLDYAILASGSDSIGDLQFDFNLPTRANVSAIDIFVMPEFKFLAPTLDESVWSDITNDYGYITVSTLNAYDKVAPGWTQVEVGAEGGWNITEGIYHIRLMDLAAPNLAGIAFFKIAWYDTAGNQHILAAADYPFVVVKTDLNPAWVEVTVRTSGHDALPFASGRVIAVGTTPEGRSVMGATYWGPGEWIDNNPVTGSTGAEYRTWILGLAAGTYTLTAEASGFLPTTTDRITVDPGQSYHTYIVVYYSPEVSVTVWSKHGTGAVVWGNLWQLPYGTNNPDFVNMNATWRDIMLELYDTNNNLIAFWASNVLGANDKPKSTALGPIAGTPAIGGAILPHPGPSPVWLHGVGPTKSISATTKLLGYHDDEAPAPNAVSYSAKLCDNFDPIGAPRMYPSTHWDGHVPWATADYVAGYANGDYTVEGFVTGYIMDEADAYQRAFSLVGSSMNLQFDLRRSNWLDVSMHLPGNTFLSWLTTVTLTAEDAAGSERGAIAFLANNTMSLDGVLDGIDATLYYNNVVAPAWAFGSGTDPHIDTYHGGIIIEGWNAVFPNAGGKSGSQDIWRKDYGLNPTASTHSSGAVTLAGNPYTIKLYMADMGIPYNPPISHTGITAGYRFWNATGWYSILGGDPQASIFLCNSRVALSFSLTNAHVEISLRSVDFEIPAHSRPWTFPGSEIKVLFTNTADPTITDTLDPTIYGLFQDPGYLNYTGLMMVVGLLHGGGFDNYWAIPGVTYPETALPIDERHGLGWTPYDIDNVNMAGHHEHLWVPYFGTDYCSPTIGGGYPIYRALLTLRSTRLPAGEYTFEAMTHGYIMRRASLTASYPVQIPQSGIGDIEADLIQGGQIRVTVDFYHEGVPTGFHGFIYAEAFDSAGNFVGASIYGQAQPNLFTRVLHGGGYLEYSGYPFTSIGSNTDWMVDQGPAQAAGLNGWNGTTDYLYQKVQQNANINAAANEHYLLNCTGPGSGLGQVNSYPSCSYSQRAYQAWLFHTYYGVPEPGFPPITWGNWSGVWYDQPQYTVPQSFYFPGNRVDMEPGQAQSMDIYGFYMYYGNAVRTWAGGWPVPAGGNSASQADYGMQGSVPVPGFDGSGAGLYTVKVWAFDSRGPNNMTELSGAFSDDWRMYAMGGELTNVQVPWGGAVELYVPMNDMATLTGTVRWFDMYGDLRALPWAQVTASPGPSTDAYAAYQTSNYIMWLPAGTHDVSVSTSEAPQVWTSAAPTQNAAYTVVVSDGWVGGGDSQLSTSGTPVPEVPAFAAPLALFAVLAASVWLLRKKNYNIPVLMK
jgi:hypothetical protein